MNIAIQSLKFKADQKLENFVQEKVNKVAALYSHVVGAEVILKLEKDEDRENKIAEIRLKVPGNDLFAIKQSRTFEQATDEACDALRSQIEKLKK